MSEQAQVPRPYDTPVITIAGPWDDVFHGQARAELEQALPAFILPRRWFGAKTRTIRAVTITDAIPVSPAAYLALARLSYRQGGPDTYLLPLAFAGGHGAQALVQEHGQAVVARLQAQGEPGILYDAIWHPGFCQALLDLMEQDARLPGATGELVASTTNAYSRLRGDRTQPLPSSIMGVEQSNTSVRYGSRLMLKMFRHLEVGNHPDLEIGRFLTEQMAFDHIAPVAGTLQYQSRQPGEAGPIALAILQGFVPNQGDAWRYTLDSLAAYFGRVSVLAAPGPEGDRPARTPILRLASRNIPAAASETIGAYLGSAKLLGRRTAQLHLALASDPDDPDFAPEPFTPAYQEGLYQDMRDLGQRMLRLLRESLSQLPATVQPQAEAVLEIEDKLAQRFHTIVERPITALRTRIHGDYHLGQVLYTGQDFVIIDFEGEPARTLEQRRQKRSPLQDVAGMLRSFHYAAYAAYFQQAALANLSPQQRQGLRAWTDLWHRWVSVAFLQAYLATARDASFLPNSAEELARLLNAYLLEKAVYELGYELNNRPDWVMIPLQGILQILEG